MVRPLVKQDRNGALYSRSDAVERAIEGAIQQDCSTLCERAWDQNPDTPEFLPSECLVYLIREAWRRRDEQTMNALLPPLLSRCEMILRSKIPDGLPNAADIRDMILGDFSELFVEDESNSSQLDYFECRFNRAFRAFRIDHLRAETARTSHLVQLPTDDDDLGPSSEDDLFARISPVFRNSQTQVNDLIRNRLLTAISELPRDERRAVVLCHMLGFKVESEDPNEKTVASLCGVTGRTIRNRLQKAASKLSGFIEER